MEGRDFRRFSSVFPHFRLSLLARVRRVRVFSRAHVSFEKTQARSWKISGCRHSRVPLRGNRRISLSVHRRTDLRQTYEPSVRNNLFRSGKRESVYVPGRSVGPYLRVFLFRVLRRSLYRAGHVRKNRRTRLIPLNRGVRTGPAHRRVLERGRRFPERHILP